MGQHASFVAARFVLALQEVRDPSMSAPEPRIVSLQPRGGTFDFRDGPAFAAAYLDTYYRQPPTADETVVSKFLVEEFARRPPAGRFIELGCGPTVHHVFPFVPHVDEIHLADYLEDNLGEVRLWTSASPKAHDWSQYVGMTLRHERRPVGPEAVAERERLARAKITRLLACDLKEATPAERRACYDAVGCFYCAEEIGISPAEWRRVVANVAEYLRPGGTLYMAALAGMKSYTVRDRAGTRFEYPCAFLEPAGVGAALEELGFPRGTLRLESADIEHPDCGVTATLVVAAVKQRRE
jgi:hypothetical protein